MIADPNEHFEPEQPPEEPEQPAVTFPKTFDACPRCGSKVRLGMEAIRQMKEQGLVHKDSFPNGLVHQIPMLDQAHPPTIIGPTIKIPILLVYWDVCECGEMYCTNFVIQQAPAQVQMQKQQPPPGFRGFRPPGGRSN